MNFYYQWIEFLEFKSETKKYLKNFIFESYLILIKIVILFILKFFGFKSVI